MSKRQFGLIYISSYQARLFIVDLKKMTILEQLNSAQFVQGGKKFEVYENELPRLTDALIGFKRKLAEYGIDNCKVYGNRQLLDKISARYLSDQIKIRTGLDVEWLNGAQIAYYKIIAGMALPQFSELAPDESTYLLSTGSAMLNLTLFKGQNYVSTWDFALGPEEIEEMSAMTRDTPIDPIDIISDYISRKLVSFKTIEKPTGKSRLIIQHVSSQGEQSLKPHERAQVIEPETFAKVYNDFKEAPDQYLMEKYNLTVDSLARMKPTIVLVNQLNKVIKPEKITLTESSAITGLMLQEAARLKYRPDEYSTIVLTATKNIARRYESGGKHSNLSNKFALHIFDRLAHAGMVDKRDRQLLEIAARLHDIGNFINFHNHYEHAAYIIDANQIIGLSDRENAMLISILKHQDITNLNDEEKGYRSLDPAVQVRVAKLAAILRLANSLDASRKQKISKIVVSIKDDQMLITVTSKSDLTLERWVFEKNVPLAQAVFGMKIAMKQKRGK